MKVIFLDFDGVLNSAKYRNSVPDYYSNFIDESRMPFLKQIIEETGAVIVLTTTWRMYWDKCEVQVSEDTQKINNMFDKYGLTIYSKTDTFDENRNFEISMWLCRNEVENYVILDDMDFRWSEENRKHFVKTDDDNQGIDEQTTNLAIRILNNNI